MGVQKVTKYTATALTTTVENLVKRIGLHMMMKFPKNTFKIDSIIFNTQSSISNFLKDEGGKHSGRRIETPRAIITSSLMSDPEADDIGAGLVRNKLDIGFYNHKRRYELYKNEETEMMLSSTEVWRQIKIDFRFELSTASDMEILRGHIYASNPSIGIPNYIKDVSTEIILPNMLMHDMMKLVLGPNSTREVNDREIFLTELNDHCRALFFQRVMRTKTENYRFALERVYDRIHIFMGKPEEPEVDKEGKVNTQFVLNLPLTIQLKLPLMYYLSFNTMNAMGVINELSFANPEMNEAGEIVADIGEAKFVDTRKYKVVVPRGFDLVHKEEFMLAAPTDYVSMRDFLPSAEVDYMDILDYMSVKERANMFIIQLYEGGFFIDYAEYLETEISNTDNIIHISQGNVKMNHMVYIYVNMIKYKRYAKIIASRKSGALEWTVPVAADPPQSTFANPIRNDFYPLIGDDSI